jgi:hypothetical protein
MSYIAFDLTPFRKKKAPCDNATVATLQASTPQTVATVAPSQSLKSNSEYAAGDQTVATIADTDRDSEERAAIAQHEGKLPPDIAEGLARLDTMRPPEGFGQSRWQLIVNDAALFADAWGARALALGWQPIELFGIHPEKPDARLDCRGLAFLLNGGTVVAMDAASATIVTPNGTKQRYSRWHDDPGAKLAWALNASSFADPRIRIRKLSDKVSKPAAITLEARDMVTAKTKWLGGAEPLPLATVTIQQAKEKSTPDENPAKEVSGRRKRRGRPTP